MIQDSQINKKVHNATKNTYFNIDFKSKLEKSCYILCRSAGFDVDYEPFTFTICDKLTLSRLTYYAKRKKLLVLFPKTIRPITYTPDFHIHYKGYRIFIETKGKSNDAYPIKKKLFFSFIENSPIFKDSTVLFFEPRNIGDLKEMVLLIKNLK